MQTESSQDNAQATAEPQDTGDSDLENQTEDKDGENDDEHEDYEEEDLSVDAIVERGFERETVKRILGMVQRNEYKRRQAPPGVRISSRAFGRDWRYPITSGYRFPE